MKRATLIALAITTLVRAEVAAGDFPFFGDADFGLTASAQAFDARTHQHPYPNKYDEHSHTPEGLALDETFVAAANERTLGFLTLRLLDAGQRDQRFSAELGQFGTWHAEASFATIPSVFMHATRTPFAYLGHGRLIVDEAIRRDLQEAIGDELVTRARRVATTSAQTEVGFRRNTLAGRMMWRPADWLEVRIGATDQMRNGTMPFSIGAFDIVSSGFSILMFEIAEPVERRTDELMAGMTVRGGGWHFDVDASASQFRNTIAFIDYDNPFRVTHAASEDGLTGRMSASRGHITSAPNATSRAIRASGAFSIGERAHVGASLTWMGMTQDQRFVPWTLNLAIPGSELPAGLGPTNAEALPRPSLQGRASILSTDDSVAIALTSALTLTLRYRDYDFNSRTPDLQMPGYAGFGDAAWRTEFDGSPILAAGHSFRRQTAQTDLVWDRKPLRARLSHAREIWRREERQSRRTEDDSIAASLQFRSGEWHGRTTARHRRRRGYLAADEALVPFDTAGLARNDATALGVWSPTDRLSVTGAATSHQSDYGGRYGLQRVSLHDANVALHAAITDSFDATARVSRDGMSYDYVHAGAWGRDVRDTSTAAGIEILKSAGRFTARAGWEIATGDQKIVVTTGDETQEWPRVRTTWQRLETGLEVEVTPRWHAGVRYRYSPFTLDDYATNDLSVYPFDEIAPITDARRVLLLDARYAGHEVHVLAIYFRLTSDAQR